MKRIYSYLFLIDFLETGGIQRQILEVCKEIVRRGNKCAVASFRSERDEMSQMFRSAGVEVIFLNKKSKIDLGFLMRLRSIIKKNEYDLIHAMTPQTAFWTSLILPFDSMSCFVSALLNVYKFEKFSERFCERVFVAPRLHAVFVNSDAGRKQYENKIPSHPEIWRIYNGVNTGIKTDKNEIRTKLKIADDEVAVVCIGRLEPVKNHETAVKVMSILKNKHRNAKLHIVGDGVLRSKLEKLACELKCDDRVVFHGLIDNVEQIIPAFDILLLPSLSEGFPNVLLEGMAAGIPCTAAAVGGIPEAITHGKDGFLFKSKDAEEISGILSKLIESKELRNRIGAEGYQTALRRFDMPIMLDIMISHYEDLIRRKKSDIAYISSQFPKLSETFILREIADMNRRGFSCCVVSLKTSNEKIVQPDAEKLKEKTIFEPLLSSKVILRNIYYLLTRPAKYLGVFLYFIMLHKQYATEIIKALVIWLKVVSLAFVLKKKGVRHVHGNWATIPAACSAAIAKLINKSYSFTAHAHDIYGLPTAIPRKIADADFVTTCTKRNAEHLSSLVDRKLAEKIHLVRHFIENYSLENMPEAKTNPPVILSVGSLQTYKGYDILVKGFHNLIKKGYNLTLRIIGDGYERENIERLSTELGISDKVEIAGFMAQTGIFKAMREAAVFVTTSIKRKRGEDNLPNVLIEASLMKLPCVVSDIGSVNEFIEHEKTGLLFPSGDYINMSEMIEKILKNKDFGKKMAENACRAAIDIFGVEKNAAILQELFRNSKGLSELYR